MQDEFRSQPGQRERLSNNRTVLLVDDELQVINSLKRSLGFTGYEVLAAHSGQEALELLDDNEVGVVISDQMMPGMTGLELLEQVKERNPDVARILITGYGSLNNAMAAINSSQVFSYLVKPCKLEVIQETVAKGLDQYNLLVENRVLHEEIDRRNAELLELNAGLDEMVQQRTRQLEDAVKEGVIMLAMAAETKEGDTGEHIRRIETVTRDLCLALDMPPDAADDFAFFSIMHDVGKLSIPDRILSKEGPLTEEEYRVVQGHTIAGEKILGNQPFYHLARQVARSHHENWDGSGYPDGLAGQEIPLPARIVTIADTFDALAHQRPYKPAWPLDQIISEMGKQSGIKYQPELIETFIAILPDNYERWLQVSGAEVSRQVRGPSISGLYTGKE